MLLLLDTRLTRLANDKTRLANLMFSLSLLLFPLFPDWLSGPRRLRRYSRAEALHRVNEKYVQSLSAQKCITDGYLGAYLPRWFNTPRCRVLNTALCHRQAVAGAETRTAAPLGSLSLSLFIVLNGIDCIVG